MTDWSSDLRAVLVDKAPGLGRVKRVGAALMAATRAPRSYSQHGEDTYLFDRLRSYRLDAGMYIDVGANHPMTLSNTYRFYREGYSGVVVEPYDELINLHRRFRPRDLAVAAACGDAAGVASFHVSKAPVLSSLSPVSESWKVCLTPVVTVDDIAAASQNRWIYLLSVDVEGHDFAVLKGAEGTIDRVFWVCVEVNDHAEEATIRTWLEARGFVLGTKLGCNLLMHQPLEKFERWRR